MVVKEDCPKGGVVDELAVIKAAAWAWYERGSGLEHKSSKPESDCTRTRSVVPEPSRYKLEAMKKASFRGSMLSFNHADNSLLDVYEIERIAKELDYYIESSSKEDRRKSIGGGRGGRRIAVLPETDGNGTKGSKGKSNKKKGFWMWHGGSCRPSKDDVVENVSLVIGRTQSLGDRVPVVGVLNSR